MSDQELRLLALDGGGVRGLSALLILEQLMETINPDAPPKPCDYFDMIGGTSTGGLIAIMLGRLRMSVGESIDAYLALSDRIFQKKRHRVTVKGNIQGRFDSEELARAVKEVIRNQGLEEDALLKDAPDAACKVFVCATSGETSETACLTSYRSPRGNNDLLNSVKTWEACRATSAASSFFDRIAVGRFGEEFLDGGTGANNPVWELWNQAQLIWGPQPLEDRIKCVVSIGTGVPSLKPFRDDVLHIGETLVAIATETEQTAKNFQRDKAHLDNTGRYYRFNVARGLQDIGLEESKKTKEIAAATRLYIESPEVFKQMQACVDNVTRREYSGKYRTVFSLQGVPRATNFVDRPAEILELERDLLPKQQSCRQSIHVLHGLGGIGKTQLAVEFARRHHRKFSSVFWLDGRSKDTLKRSIASCASKIPRGQIPETSRVYSTASSNNVDAVFGDPQQLGKVDEGQAQAILKNWYKRKYDTAESERLLKLLDGLPLASAQAGAYLQESRVGITTYLTFYEQQWSELMKSRNEADTLLQDYPGRSVGTTWTISYNAIRNKHKATANLLLLWSFLDNKNLWYGLFKKVYRTSSVNVRRNLSKWIGNIGSNELEFSRAMQLLRNYSLIEDIEELASYATHPVVHRWAYYYQGKCFESALGQLAVVIVGWAVPEKSARDYSALQRRLLPHVQACSRWVFITQIEQSSRSPGGYEMDFNEGDDNDEDGGEDNGKEQEVILDAINFLGLLYADQGELVKAKEMYKRALQGCEEALGPKHKSTLNTVHNLGLLYRIQGKMAEAEQMYKRALQGCEEALGPKHTSTLVTVNNLGLLYADQGKHSGCNSYNLGSTTHTVHGHLRKLAKAEQMYERALQETEEALGPKHTSKLDTVNNLGLLYTDQGKLAEAEQMYERALQGYEEALGPKHTSTLNTVNNLGLLYAGQGKLAEAEQMYKRALQGYEEALGHENVEKHKPALNTIENMGNLYAKRGEFAKAQETYSRALVGLQSITGPFSAESQRLRAKIATLDSSYNSSAEPLVEAGASLAPFSKKRKASSSP
ncbi:FabD/lysophospholipase-like protein [Mytilinidion resinicola]|uniref:FabD/lysophospholipase-like protein n=1 Tax=Mytilinidion resinicola TaxID=574789 RepID=A0A6A6YW17_9PEZI|nr:FabD/lysophospholipase-like protein [Mytilinidion resinicola]KAF2812175.1 FabD/lysophospholipase-like protein [Mytilinidion resinicola]